MIRFCTLLVASLLLAVSMISVGCGGGGTAPSVLKVAGIPNKTNNDLAEEYAIVRDYLAKELGMPVQFEIVANYDAAVAALINGQVDMCWLGGHTTVIAEEEMGDNAVLVACRELDRVFKSYFICNAAHIDTLRGSTDLSGMKTLASGRKFSFGNDGSTSGHLMPRWFMNQQGCAPEDTFGKDSVQFSGNHSKTLQAVADGTADFGAMDQTVWDNASDELKAKAPIFYTTPGYTDYCWVANRRITDDLIARIRAAFVKLDPANPEHKPILDKWDARAKFIEPNKEWWDDIRAVRSELVTKGILKKFKK